MAGDTRYAASQELPDFEYARYAELVGLRGIRVDRAGAARRPRGTRRSSSPMPVLLEVIVDPDVPPLPPHITLEQMQSFGMSLLKGEEGEGSLVKQAIEHMFPGIAKKL